MCENGESKKNCVGVENEEKNIFQILEKTIKFLTITRQTAFLIHPQLTFVLYVNISELHCHLYYHC